MKPLPLLLWSSAQPFDLPAKRSSFTGSALSAFHTFVMMPTEAYLLFFKPFEGGVILGVYTTAAKAEKQAGRFISKYNKKHSAPTIEGAATSGPLVAESENWREFKVGKVCAQWSSDWDALYILRCDMDAAAEWDPWLT